MNARALAKYEGTWVQQCAEPIALSGGGYGNGSVRETLVISSPDSAGVVNIESTEEFFDSTVPCYDAVTPAMASVKNVIPVTGRFARKELAAALVGNAEYDVVSVNQLATAVTATGAGITSVDVAGVANWRITFSDGNSTDRAKTFAARTGEVGMLTSVVNPGQAPPSGFTEIFFYGDTQPYIKRAP